MPRPSPRTLGIATVLGGLNVVTVVALHTAYDYPVDESPVAILLTGLVVFVPGFVVGLVAAHTGLLAPILGFLALLAGMAIAEVTTPPPDWETLGDNVVVQGELFVSSYWTSWYLWLSVLLIAGVVEFAFRRGYGIADGRLRNLPDPPFSGPVLAWIAGGFGALFGAAALVFVVEEGIRPSPLVFFVFVAAWLAVVVPLVSVLRFGLLAPTVLFFPVIGYGLIVEVFQTTDSPVFFLLLGPFALILAAAGVIEYLLRYRFADDPGGRWAYH